MTNRGRDPGLLEWVADGWFRYRVFPIEAREVKRVAVDVEQWLPRRSDIIELRLPVNHPAAQLTVNVQDPRPIRTISSPTHELEIERYSDRHVELRATGAGPEAELVLQYQVIDQPGRLVASIHRDPDQPAFVVLTLPRFESSARGPKDVTLVLDRSGSMGGEPLESVRRAALRVLDGLREDDRTNIVTFSGDAEALYDHPQTLTKPVRAEARAALRGMYQQNWGSRLDRAMTEALSRQLRDEHADLVLFFSDGQSVTGLAATATALADPSDMRVFTVGAGRAPDQSLLSRLARAKGGRLLCRTETPGASACTDELLRVRGIARAGVSGLAFDGQWLYATTAAALWRIDPKKGRPVESWWSPAGSRTLQAVAASNGSVWLASEDRGAIFFDGRRCHAIDRTRGLPTSWMLDVTVGADGAVFAATLRDGVLRVAADGRWSALEGVLELWTFRASRS